MFVTYFKDSQPTVNICDGVNLQMNYSQTAWKQALRPIRSTLNIKLPSIQNLLLFSIHSHQLPQILLSQTYWGQFIVANVEGNQNTQSQGEQETYTDSFQKSGLNLVIGTENTAEPPLMKLN